MSCACTNEMITINMRTTCQQREWFTRREIARAKNASSVFGMNPHSIPLFSSAPVDFFSTELFQGFSQSKLEAWALNTPFDAGKTDI